MDKSNKIQKNEVSLSRSLSQRWNQSLKRVVIMKITNYPTTKYPQKVTYYNNGDSAKQLLDEYESYILLLWGLQKFKNCAKIPHCADEIYGDKEST